MMGHWNSENKWIPDQDATNPFANLMKKYKTAAAPLPDVLLKSAKVPASAAAAMRAGQTAAHHTPNRFDDAAVSTAAALIIEAGRKARGEIPTPMATPIGEARKVLESAVLRDAGGPERPAPTGLAAQIIAAGKKRRGEK